MVDQKKLQEKIRYLITFELGNLFDIKNVMLELEYNNNKIESYNIQIEFEYNGSIELEVYIFTRDIKKMGDKLRDATMSFIINSEGKLIKNTENSSVAVSDCNIYQMEYIADEKYYFYTGFDIFLN